MEVRLIVALLQRYEGCSKSSGGAPSRAYSLKSSFSATAPSPAESSVSRCLPSVLIMLSFTSPPPNVTRLNVSSSRASHLRLGVACGVCRARIFAPGQRLTVAPGRAKTAVSGPSVTTTPCACSCTAKSLSPRRRTRCVRLKKGCRIIVIPSSGGAPPRLGRGDECVDAVAKFDLDRREAEPAELLERRRENHDAVRRLVAEEMDHPFLE